MTRSLAEGRGLQADVVRAGVSEGPGAAPISLLDTLPDGFGSALEEFLAARGEASYRISQVREWIFRRGVDSFSAMTNLPLPVREALAERFTIAPVRIAARSLSADGSEKLLVEAADGARVESVLIAAGERRATLCISSQVGCSLRCAYCATGMLGLKRNLTVGEMLGQVLLARTVRGGRALTNIVFMGMGEPFLNYERVLGALRVLSAPEFFRFGARRVTVSTAGIPEGIERLAADSPQTRLAVSLGAPTDTLRGRLMPIDRRSPLAELLAACRAFARTTRKRVTFEYVLLPEVNDGAAEARQLGRLLASIRCKINLIPWNPVPGAPFRAPTERDVLRFQEELLSSTRHPVTVRWSKGSDIAAACGQLVAGGEPLPMERSQ